LQNKAFGTANTVNAVLVSLFTLLGAWLLKNNGIVIGQYLAVFIMLWMLWKRYDVPLIGAEEDLPLQDKKDLFTIAGISTLNNALSQMLTLLGTFMLGLIISNPVMIASYKVASAIPMALNFIPSALMVYLYPYFARNRHNKAWVKSKYKTILLFAGMANLFISIIGIVFAEQIIRIIFGDSYSDATLPFQVLMGSYFISGTFRTISGNLLVTQRKLKVNTVNGIVGAVVSIVMNAILIPGRGSMGAAISYLITMIITSLIAVYYFSAAINEIGVEQVL
jgi:O-antigen/teichoic acid export membrane protein